MAGNAYELFLYFTLYSVLGWVCESIWVSVGTRKITNRGFLTGPYCPIYGFGALIVLFTCVPLKAYPWLVFLLAMLLTSLLEYFTGWLLETLFHTRWWDYSKRKFNIKGRVCLRNSLLFGLMGLVATYLLHPIAAGLIGDVPITWQRPIALAIAALLLADLLHALFTILHLRQRLAALHAILQQLEAYNTEYTWFAADDLSGSIVRLRKIAQGDPANEQAQKILLELDTAMQRRAAGGRLIKAFPSMVDKDFHTELSSLKAFWSKEKAKLQEKLGK